ncbi:MAG TPA: hypothetical protein VFD92_27865 [Candidatus Binatia bacterium]|nr:hypothetical protein [Candidatus Binatia bacterium]
MSLAIAEAVVGIAGIYLGAGLVFALAFVALGVGRIDPAASRASIGFRIVILPGCALLWPLLARRWLSGSGMPPEERDAHAAAALTGSVQ